jgi:hypothetical protein
VTEKKQLHQIQIVEGRVDANGRYHRREWTETSEKSLRESAKVAIKALLPPQPPPEPQQVPQ